MKQDRRQFLAAAALASVGARLASAAPTKPPRGKAEHVVFLWLGGGMAQIDTFDAKQLGDPKGKPKKAGSAYKAIPTAVGGVQFTEHLAKTARLADRLTVVRTVNHKVIDEHAAATNLVHTGRTTSGNIVYPSIGSIVANQRGAADPGMPAYMLMGYPNPSRGPGFLGAGAGYIYLTDTTAGPAGFTPPENLSTERQARRADLLKPLPDRKPAGAAVEDYERTIEQSRRYTRPEFMKIFRLDEEPGAIREKFGGEFGQRCLLARRLIQSGVRFIEVSHNLNFLNGTGWDTHNEGQLNQHLLIRELDSALSALIEDLEEKKLLDKTLIVLGTEFGRPAEFDGRGGRGHQGDCFSLLLAGGGLKHCGAYGVTDDLSKKPVEDPVSIPDFHATVHCALGIDPAKELMDGSRPVPITDGGRPIARLF